MVKRGSLDIPSRWRSTTRRAALLVVMLLVLFSTYAAAPDSENKKLATSMDLPAPGEAKAQTITPPQPYDWVNQFEVFSYNDAAVEPVIDSKNDVYVAGTGWNSVYLAKFAPTGATIWKKSTEYIENYSKSASLGGVVVDSQDNVYFYYSERPYVTPDRDEAILVKYSPDGTELWRTKISVPYKDTDVGGIAIGADDSLYVAGSSTGRVDGGASSWYRNQFLAKYASDGTRSWLVQARRSVDNSVFDIALSGSSVYLLEPYGKVTRYDGSGSELWSKVTSSEWTYRQEAVGSDGGLLLAGSTKKTPSGSPIVEEGLLAKIGEDGTVVWSKRLATGEATTFLDLRLDKTGNIYLTGNTQGVLPGNKPVSQTDSPNGNRDAFLVKYRSDGSVLWGTQFGSYGFDAANDVALTSDGEALVVGSASDAMPGSGHKLDTADTSYAPPSFIVKLPASPRGDSANVATNQPPDLLSNPTRLAGPVRTESPSDVGDPVNVATGNAYVQAQDSFVPGRGLAVQFARFYNSQDDQDSPVGYGWTHIYNSSLKVEADGSATEISSQGSREPFALNQDGTYTAPQGTGNQDVLTRISEGVFDLRKKNGVVWRYERVLSSPDALGMDSVLRLKRITDPNANALTFSYESGLLTRITDTVGRDFVLDYDADRRLDSLTDPAGRVVRYAHDAAGNLVSVTDAAGAVTSYEYDAQHNLTATKAPDTTGSPGTRTIFDYDAQDRAVLTQADGGTGKMTFAYDSDNLRTFVKDSKGNESVFRYDQAGRVLSISNPLGRSKSYSWDIKGNLLAETNEAGYTHKYSYDNRGNRTRTTRPSLNSYPGMSSSATYEAKFNLPTSTTDFSGAVTKLDYDERGNLVRITDPLLKVTTLSYDEYGLPIKVVTPEGRASYATYDAAGNPERLTDAAGNSTVLQSDVLGRITKATDALGRTTSFDYDALDRVRRIELPALTPNEAPAVELYDYDARGNLTDATDTMGRATTAKYDEHDRLVQETLPGNGGQSTTRYEYDTEGNLRRTVDALGNATTTDYDALRRPVKVTRPDGTTAGAATSYAYNITGTLAKITDPKGRATTLTYDKLDRITEVNDGARATYNYDNMDRVTSFCDPKSCYTRYEYDKVGHLVKKTDPLGSAWSFTYDGDGNLTSRVDANGKATKYAYDALSRPTVTTYPDASREDVAYDAVGNLTSVTDSKGRKTSYAYDARDRLVAELLPDGSALKHAYDDADARTAMTLVDPDGGQDLTRYSYDGAGRLKEMLDPSGGRTIYDYDLLNRVTRETLPNGTQDTHAYDAAGRVTSAATLAPVAPDGSSGGVLRKTAYAYDKAGNITGTTDEKGVASSYSYDGMHRLTRETHPSKTLSYAYDVAGNRTQMIEAKGGTSVTTAYTYDAANRMTKAGLDAFAYDKNGNQISRTDAAGVVTPYGYDFEDRLVKAGDASYEYDAEGRRTAAVQGAQRTEYLHDGGDVLREKIDGEALVAYTQGAGGITARYQSGAPDTYYHNDALGSVVALTDSAGAKSASYAYDVFGGVREYATTAPQQPYGYVGNRALPGASGLRDFNARAYDPATGRFMQADPVGGVSTMSQSMNRYGYGWNNPLTHPDANGEFPWVPVTAAAGAIINTGVYLATEDDPSIGGAAVAAVDGGATGAMVGTGVGIPAAVAKVGAKAAVTTAGKGALEGGATAGGAYYLQSTQSKGGFDWGEFGRVTGAGATAGAITGNRGAGSVDDALDFAKNTGRGGKQTHLRSLADDPKVSSADRGWIKSEMRQIEAGKRKTIRVPPGKHLAHKRGYEARRGYDYSYSVLNNAKDHVRQHRLGGYR